MLELYHWEPNGFYLKPLIALEEKGAPFTSRWFDPTSFEQTVDGFPSSVESRLTLEREGPLLVADGEVISSTFFMLEYIADALPGTPLLPDDAYDQYRARASGQFLGAHLGSLVPILGCMRYLVPRLAAMDRATLDAKLASVAPLERRLAWQALIDGTYTPQILVTARERLKFPVARIESQLASGP